MLKTNDPTTCLTIYKRKYNSHTLSCAVSHVYMYTHAHTRVRTHTHTRNTQISFKASLMLKRINLEIVMCHFFY